MADIAPPDAVGGNTGLLGEYPGGKPLRLHLERKEANDRPVLGNFARLGGSRGQVISRCVKRDVSGQCRLPHRRPTGEDDQIGRMQPAQLAVEIEKPGGHPDGFAAALESRLGIEEGISERIIKTTKPAFALTGRGEVEQCLFSPLNLIECWIIEVLSKCVVYDVLTQCNQRTSKVEIVDNTTVILRIYNCRRRIRKTYQILRPTYIG